MKFRLLIAIFVAVVVTAAGCSSDSDDPAEVVEQYVAAYNSGDIDAVMAVFTEDAVMYGHPIATRHESAGFGAIRRALRDDLAQSASTDPLSISNIEVDGDTVTWDSAWVNRRDDTFCQVGQSTVIKDGKILTWTWPPSDGLGSSEQPHPACTPTMN